MCCFILLKYHNFGSPCGKRVLSVDEFNFVEVNSLKSRGSAKKGRILFEAQNVNCQKLPADFENKLMQCQCHAICLYTKCAYEFKNTGNTDKTSMSSDVLFNYIETSQAMKVVKVFTTEYKTQCITVMLCIKADSQKLPPLTVNRKLVPKK